MSRAIRRVALAAAVAQVLVLPTQMAAQEPLRKIFKDLYGLSFIVVPPSRSAFGVGTIIKGRGKNLQIHCFAPECLPDHDQLRKANDIKWESFRLEIGTARVDRAVLKMFGLGAEAGRAKYINLKLTNAKLEEISFHAADRIYRSHLTESGKKLLRTGCEMVYRAVCCDEARFVLLDAKGGTISLPQATAGLQSDGVTCATTGGWIAFKSLRYKEKSGEWKIPPTAAPRPEGWGKRYLQIIPVEPDLNLETVVDVTVP